MLQVTPTQGSGTTQVSSQESPPGQPASQVGYAAHLPVPGLQLSPAAQRTPLQALP
jgi:hypothetical protein